jgi:hypothetical protein
MSPTDPFTEQLRRNQLLQQMQQASQANVGGAMLGGGANLQQFNDTGGGTQTTQTLPQVTPRPRGTPAAPQAQQASGPIAAVDRALAKVPQAIANAPAQAAQAIYNRAHGLGGAPNPTATEIPPEQQPTLTMPNPAGPGTVPAPRIAGPQLAMDASGNLVVRNATPVPQDMMPQAPQYSPFAPNLLPQGKYNPNF